VEWGSLAAWFSGIGSLVASAIALVIAAGALREAREVRRAASRDRAARLLVELIRAVEEDIAAAEGSSDPNEVVRSAQGAALCRALYGRRNAFGTAWAVYCDEEDEYRGWIESLRGSGQLFPRMREELQSALDALDYEDRSP
jgi:hypothetical protein